MLLVKQGHALSALSRSNHASRVLHAAGGLVDLVFMLLVDLIDGYALLVFAGVALCSAAYVFFMLPETKGHSLAMVQAIINGTDDGGHEGAKGTP